MSYQKPRARRMREQRWTIDKIVESHGVDFSWPMTGVTAGAAGLAIMPDIIAIRNSVKKYIDISRQFARVGVKREAMARKAEASGHIVSARDHYYEASIFYAMAQWPIHEDDNEEIIGYNIKKNECYDKYMENAPHRIERVEIPFENNSLPGLMHFPVDYKGGKLPCIVSIDGMDGFKEQLVTNYGDNLLERGMAVLALDGPGQGECCLRKIHCTADNFTRVAKIVLDYVTSRQEINEDKIGLTGISMGSFWSTQMAASDTRFKAAAAILFCHEPGMNTIFNMAAPTFKNRYMWMAGYEDEEKFDEFARTLTLEGVGEKIRCPFLMLGGEDDELSPVEYSYALYNSIKSPKKIVVYQNDKHEIRAMQDLMTMVADWLKERLDGKPMDSEIIYIDVTGREFSK